MFSIHDAQIAGKRTPIVGITVEAQAIFAELIGSDRCSALGMTERSSTPVLTICRRLVEAGHDPATPLEAWRGDVLCLRIRSIGEAAQLEPSPRGVGFVRGRPPVAQTARILPADQQHNGAAP
jgi:hypothetical protein